MKARLEICKERCNYFRKNGKYYRRRHLNKRLEAARDREDDLAEKKILAIIHREKERAYWRRLNRSVREVQVADDSGVTEYETQDEVHKAIWAEVHQKRFYLAEEAPICKDRLRGEFGYSAVSPTARAILDGTYGFPEDIDPSTRELMVEIAQIRNTIPSNSVQTKITSDL